MAKNPNVGKMKRQRVRRRRGAFRTHSVASTLDPNYIKQQTPLRQFWAERINVRKGTGPNGKVQSARGSNIPDDARGTFMNHAKHRPEHREDNSTPRSLYFLSMMFPGARFVSKERNAVLQQIRDIIGEADPTSCIVAERSRFRITYLYYNPTKTLWWFVEQDKFTVKSSITYGSQERARSCRTMGTIRWSTTRVFSPDSS